MSLDHISSITKADRLRHELQTAQRWILPLALVATVWAVSAAGSLVAIPAHLLVGVFGTAAAVIDARSFRLPDLLTIPLVFATAGLLAGAAALAEMPRQFATAIVGGAVLAAVYWVLHLLNPTGLGLGDVKLAGSLGMLAAWHGWATLAVAGAAPFALASLAAAAMLAARRANRHTALALGPWMVAGTAVAISWARLTGAG